MLSFLLGLFFSFLCGAFPTGYLVGKFVDNVDIRTIGSSSTGATNVSRNFGIFWGILVVSVDILKSIIAISILPILFQNHPSIDLPTQQCSYGLLCVIGHIWSPFLFFKGGKGIACSIGIFLVLSPQATLLTAVIFLTVIAITRYVSLGSILSAILFPWILFFTQPPSSNRIIFTTALILSCIILRKHKTNIKKLVLGKENKFSFKKKI